MYYSSAPISTSLPKKAFIILISLSKQCALSKHTFDSSDIKRITLYQLVETNREMHNYCDYSSNYELKQSLLQYFSHDSIYSSENPILHVTLYIHRKHQIIKNNIQRDKRLNASTTSLNSRPDLFSSSSITRLNSTHKDLASTGVTCKSTPMIIRNIKSASISASKKHPHFQCYESTTQNVS